MADPLPLDIPPGFRVVDSGQAAAGRYTGGDKVRFESGRVEKWPGWELFSDTALTGVARGAVSWVNQYGNVNAAFGTNLKLYVLTDGDTISDITPIRSSGTLGNNPFSTTDGSAIIEVAHVAHGADQGDYVTFTGATAVGGVTISGEYKITTKIDADSYEITHSSAATSTATGGGAAVDYEYQINIGSAGTVSGLGWGAGSWGEGTWSTPRTEGITLDFRSWSLVEYGNDLLASPSLGGLYLWQEATDARAEVVTGAPTSIRAMFVSGERFIMLLGTDTPMTIQWPDRDDITDYTPTSANTANIRALQQGSKLMGGTPLTDGINLVWSDTAVYLFQYTGSEFIYDSRPIATEAGLIGPKAFAVAGDTAYWMTQTDFMRYGSASGGVPNSADVSEFVYKRIDVTNANKTWALHDESTNQVRWHYCSSGADEPDSYVDVSLDDFSWTTGTLDRTSGAPFKAKPPTTLQIDADGYIYQHGLGTDADGAALESYITYGLYALSRGGKILDIFGIIPDCQRQVGDLSLEVYTKDRPNSAANFDEGTTTLGPTDEIADIRVSGRHFGMTIRSNEVGGDFRLGIVHLELNGAGGRR